MSGKSVTLSLKVPTRPPTLLHILENSLLEGVVDYKPLNPGIDPRAVRSREVVSAYQLKADVSVIEDELRVQFIAKNTGLHVARIFANTKEVCHAITFNITPSGDILGLDTPPPKQGLDQYEARRSKYVGSTQSAATSVASSAASTVRAVESEHRLSHNNYTAPTHSPVTLDPGSSNTQNVFEKLLHAKKGDSRPLSSVLTTEMFRSFGNSERLKFPGKFGRNIKTRCDICLRKTKLAKSVSLLEITFCDPCFTNLFLLRSAIDHFMPPTIKKSTIQVPVNKRRTKFATITKELPDVNLKGLTANDVRAAQAEFNKFDIEGDGWLEKVILLPLIKACFTPAIPEPTIRSLLCGQPLQSMIANMELNNRDRIHEIEFLSLMGFIARESHRMTQEMFISSRFTQHDLAMAYAYQQQKTKQAPSSYQLSKLHNPQDDLVKGVRKSFTDLPLSHYNPATSKEQFPLNFFYNDTGTSSPSPEKEHIKETESSEKDEPPQSEEQHQNGTMENEDETMENENATQHHEASTKKSTLGRQKSNKQEVGKDKMGELKLTGDERADGWMMY